MPFLTFDVEFKRARRTISDNVVEASLRRRRSAAFHHTVEALLAYRKRQGPICVADGGIVQFHAVTESIQTHIASVRNVSGAGS